MFQIKLSWVRCKRRLVSVSAEASRQRPLTETHRTDRDVEDRETWLRSVLELLLPI